MMNDPEIAPEMVTRERFDTTIADLQARIANLASRAAIDELQTRLQMLADAIGRMDEHVKTKIGAIETELETERTERANAVADVAAQVRHIGHTTETKLQALDSKLDARLDVIQSGIAHITGKMEGFQSVIDAQRDLYRQQQGEIERQRGQISEVRRTTQHNRDEMMAGMKTLATELAVAGETVGAMHRSIYGGADDRKSIIGMIDELSVTLQRTLVAQNAQIGAVSTRLNENAQAIAAVRDAIEDDRRKWAERRKMAANWAKNLMGSRLMWAGSITTILGGIFAANPELAAVLIELLETLMGD